jgi:mRNA interferase MazF
LSKEAYPPGSVVLVPFPFTDLSGRKRRPALVVSPEGFHDEDLILCAITSRLPQTLSEWEIPLEAGNMVEEKLPKRSVIKVGKLFTMHRDLVFGRFGTTKEQKLQEVLDKLQTLFGHSTVMTEAGSEEQKARNGLRTEEVDEAVLALLYLNAFEDAVASATPKARPSQCHSLPRASLPPKTPSKSTLLAVECRHPKPPSKASK